MNIRSLARITAACVTCVAVGFLISVQYSRYALAQGPQKSYRPFRAQYRTDYFAGDGYISRTVVSDYARFSNRTTILAVREIYPSNTDLGGTITRVDVGSRVLWEPITRSTVTTRYTPARALGMLAGQTDESCPDDVSAAPRSDIFFGFATVHQHAQLTPSWSSETWMIPELECFPVKEIDSLGGVHRGVHTDRIVTGLEHGEPPTDLLTVASGYTERTPKQIEGLYTSQSQGKPYCGQAFVKKLEKEYEQRGLLRSQ